MQSPRATRLAAAMLVEKVIDGLVSRGLRRDQLGQTDVGALFESPAAEPTQALVEAALRLRAVVQRS